MKDPQTSDVRPDQLKILKLENRGLKPMAMALIDKKTPKRRKLAAIASVGVMLIALSSAPTHYVQKLGLDSDVAKATGVSISQACNLCENLEVLVKEGAQPSKLASPLQQLFSIVENEHQKMENLAKQTGARLLNLDSDPEAAGTGYKGDPPSVWLIRLMIQASNSLVS